MTFHFPDVDLWEAVAGLQIVQALALKEFSGVCEDQLHYPLMKAGGLETGKCDHMSLAFAEAYRAVEKTDRAYCMVLAEESGYRDLELRYPYIPTIQPSEKGVVVLCPFGLKPELNLPMPLWADVVTLLRTYDYPVILVADSGQRFGNFTEGEILSERPIEEKLEALAESKLIVGVPNAYTWLATGWDKRMVYTYPENVSGRRWFPFISDRFGRISYEPRGLNRAALLAGFRKMISML